MPLVADILAQIQTAAASAQQNRTDAQTKATAAAGTADSLPACTEGIVKLDQARQSADLAHEQAGAAEALLAVLGLPTLLPLPTAAELTQATTARDNAV